MPLRTNYVLIDFENIQPKSLAALEQDHFKVFVFVGASQAKLPFEVVNSVQRMGIKAEYVQISGNGPNALDLHIAYYIGKLAAAEPGSYFHIISKDRGFDPLIQHLKSTKIPVSRVKEIGDIPFVKAVTAKTPKDRLDVLVAKLRQNEANRPRTVKTLSGTIAALFQKQLTDEEVAVLVTSLQKEGLVIVADNKVTYALGQGDCGN